MRTAPGSRKHPHFGKDALTASLTEEGISYEWWAELGGFRKAQPGSRHKALRSEGFRGYADHMETDEFEGAITRLIDTSREARTAIMCAESLWWRCHRRMIADALTVRHCDVLHVMEGGRLDRHRLSPSARVERGRLVYDVPEGQQDLLADQD